ncbi:MAG TPA: winged helix-turn-helix domain-containing protein, partial [Vicinamibacteria bacterium]|nr:winged helix-turn-helix domain-containing protein [Vicinamibacteria bacterium]
MSAAPGRKRFRFGPFTVSPARRALLREGAEVPLIPRYFDLLVLLLERRGEAVHRRQIRDAVWSDVVVSDGALSQAVRTLRRALGDDSREPVYIRTLSRHGYRFVFADVVEEAEEAGAAAPHAAPPAAAPSAAPAPAPP